MHSTVRDTSSVTGRLVVYNIQGTVSSVDPSVYDTAFVIENGQMAMQADLSLNNHRLFGSIRLKLIDDFVSDHCMEMPSFICEKYVQQNIRSVERASK